MSGKFILSPRAQDDLDDIFDYTVQRWGVDQAEVYLRQLHKHLEAVAMQPKAGRTCPELRAGYYKTHTGAHVVFYRLIDVGINVIRVLHERMDFSRHF